MLRTYLLDRNKDLIQIISTAEWASKHRSVEVGKAKVGEYTITTQFMGIDRSNFDSFVNPNVKPLPFTTYIGAKPGALFKVRHWSTWDEAVAGHREVCIEMMEFLGFDEDEKQFDVPLG
jgi:hypothetical protein